MNSKLSAIALIVAATAIASAQFDFGSAPAKEVKPWDEFKLSSKTRIKLDYRNSGVDSILAMYQRASGVTIIKDPTLTGQLTLTSAKPVSLSEAFNILATTLSLKNFELAKEGTLMIIRVKQAKQTPAFDPSAFADAGGGGRDKSKLKVYLIQYANASQLARTLNDVFADDSAANPFAGFGGGGGGGRRGGGGFGGGGFGGGQGGGNGGGGRPARAGSTVKASADDFSNSLIVKANDSDQTEVKDLIKQLDKPSDLPVQPKVYKLKYAVSDDLVSVVQNVLNSTVPRGKGGATTQQTQGPQAFFSAIRGGQAGAGQVTSESRSNSLIVTATVENLKLVDAVIMDLDTNVPIQTTTFVFPLNNARADAVSNLLQQAFGTRAGLNNAGASRTPATTPARTTNNSGTGGGRNTPAPLGGALPTSPTDNLASLPIQLQDANAQYGDLLTNVGVTQGFGRQFFGGGQGGGNQNSQNKAPTSRDEQGKLINVRDLTGQVTTVPDLNTNSIIVVTSPDNVAVIKSILDQLDKMPQQVVIETVIAEATLTATDKLGIEWKAGGSTSRVTGDPTSKQNGVSDFGLQSATPTLQGLRYTITGANLSTYINALKSDSKFQVLSSPRIFTTNNIQSQINISQSVPYVLSSRQDVNGNFTFNYAFQDVGIVLTVTPHIMSNGYVTMEVTQTANDLQGYTSFNAPIVNQRQADTTVSVKDGESVILGGIIRKTINSTVNKVPLLGDLPLLGSLFRSTSKTNEKTELLVFLTPHIIKDDVDAQQLRQRQEKQLSPETQKQLEELRKPQSNP